MAIEERKTYQEGIERGAKGFTEEDLNNKMPTLGVIVLITNSTLSLKDLYYSYKSRRKIEAYFGVFRNELDFEALGLQDYYHINAMMFILNLATSIRFKMKELIKQNEDKTIKSKSLQEILDQAKFIKMLYINNKWKVTNVTIKEHAFFTNLGINLNIPT